MGGSAGEVGGVGGRSRCAQGTNGDDTQGPRVRVPGLAQVHRNGPHLKQMAFRSALRLSLEIQVLSVGRR